MTTNLVFPFALIIVCGIFSTHISTSSFLSNSHNNTITLSSNQEKIDSWNLISRDTSPEVSNSKETYRTNQDGERIHLVVENGEIKKLKINGKKIAKSEYDDFADLIKEIRSSNHSPTPPTPIAKDAMDAHHKAMATHERAMDAHEKNIENHHKQIEKHHKEIEKQDKAVKKNNKTSEAFANQLFKDGLISDKENFSYSLSMKKFKVNGELQNKNIREKYIRLYEQQMGKAMNANSTYSVTHGSF